MECSCWRGSGVFRLLVSGVLPLLRVWRLAGRFRDPRALVRLVQRRKRFDSNRRFAGGSGYYNPPLCRWPGHAILSSVDPPSFLLTKLATDR